MDPSDPLDLSDLLDLSDILDPFGPRVGMLAFAMPVLTRAQVEAVAALAHLELEPGEVEMFARQLGDILTYADELQHLDTTGVPPTAYGVASRGADRPDEVRPSLAADEVFGNAPERDRATGAAQAGGGFFKVPRVIG